MAEVLQERLLNKAEVCVLLGISSNTLERWSREGILKPIKIGRTVRFSKGELPKSNNKNS